MQDSAALQTFVFMLSSHNLNLPLHFHELPKVQVPVAEPTRDSDADHMCSKNLDNFTKALCYVPACGK